MIFVLALFIIVPIVELYVIIKVGGAIGVGPTIVLLLLDGLLGAFLWRHQGRAAWVAFNRALAENRVPHKEVLDGVLIIFGAALLMTPGFITDIFGLILLIPPTRAMVRGATKWLAFSRLSMGPKAAVWGARGYGKVRRRRSGPEPGPAADGPRARPAAADFWWESSPPGPRPGDIEGTAHEVRDGDDQALPPGKSTSFPG